MIAYLKGKILSLDTESAVIVCANGIGFEVLCSGSARAKLEGKEEGELFTYMQTGENGTFLYGFSSVEEKAMFLKLISVSGVGPKMGIAVLSGMGMGELAAAIATSDIKKLSSIKGLGKKSAERIVLELREKVSAIPAAAGAETYAPAVGEEDAIVALMTLGFTRSESERAITRARANGAKTIEDIIMQALKGM